MELYDPEYTRNASDVDLEYTFENQPLIMQWALSRLSRCFLDLIGESVGTINVTKCQLIDQLQEICSLTLFPMKP